MRDNMQGNNEGKEKVLAVLKVPTGGKMPDEMLPVPCDCGVKGWVPKDHIDEIASGEWGEVKCPRCHAALNQKKPQKNKKPKRLLKSLESQGSSNFKATTKTQIHNK